MNHENRWKMTVKYAGGMVWLAVTVALALFLPGLYAKWQDEKLTGEVVLSNRENIEFIDTKSLDIAGRMKILSEAENFYWAEENNYVSLLEASDMETFTALTGVSVDGVIAKCRRVIGQWGENGLLPQYYSTIISSGDGEVMLGMLCADQSVLPVIVATFFGGENRILLLADLEMDLIYYAAVTGRRAEDFMAQQLGCESYTAMQELLWAGEALPQQEDARKDYGLAALTSAESAEIISDEGLEFKAELVYENFKSSVGRAVILNDMGFGLSVRMGPEILDDLILSMLLSFGEWQDRYSTEAWLEWVSEKGENMDLYDYGLDEEGNADAMNKEYQEKYDAAYD